MQSNMSIEELKRENAELKAANLKLKSQVDLMETIFDSLSEGVVATNSEGEFLLANSIAQEISGMGPDEGEGLPEKWNEIYGTFYPDKTTLVPSTELPLYKAMRGEKTDDVKLFMRNQNRPSGVFINVSGRPLYDEDNTLIGGVIVMRDTTELERVTQQLETTVNELQKQNMLMDTVFNSIGDGVIVANKEGKFLFFNPIAQEIVGKGPIDSPPEEWSRIYGTFYPDKVTPFPSTELPLYKATQGEIADNIEVFIRSENRPDGVFINVNGRPLYDEAGSLVGGVVIFHDVTQLNAVKSQLETTVNKLQTQNALMEAIFNSISDGIVVSDKDGRYVMFNERSKTMAGQDPEFVHSTEASETFGLFQPDGETVYPTDEMPIVGALQGEHADNVHMFVRNPQLPDGLDISVSARPIYGEDGIVNGAVSIIRDISDRITSEKKLIATNDELASQTLLLQSVFNSISDAVVVADSAGHIIMFNPSAERIVGLSTKSSTDIIRREQWLREYSFFYPDGVTPWPLDNLPLIQAFRGESTDNVELFIKNDKMSDGTYVNASSRPLQDGDGNKMGGVLVFHDITDRIRSQEAIAQAFIQGRLEIVDTILHNIGNAINSVTVGIDTVYNMLADDTLVSRLTALAEAMKYHEDNLGDYLANHPQGQKALPFLLTLAEDFKVADEQLRQTVGRIQNRTRHIVDIIRTQNSYQNTSGIHKDINLADAISDAVKILQDSINKRNIQIVIDCENAPTEILTQESQFHQMLVNIIKNSIEAIDESANLGKLYETPRIQFRAFTDADFLCLDITDNGIGLDPEDVDKIFSAGFTTKAQGSGLGLHSSANFVISSGGQIRVISEGKGKGTTLHIRLLNSFN
ncbi:PAS domain S-box protein [Candidatus Poribacteria bacterium]|nr:PAS domain S-box protein [Candidatus Poribacteria bacterium]